MTTSEILFGLLGLLPLIIYIILVFKNVEPLPATLICLVLAAIISRQTPLTFADKMAGSLGSFLGLIGLIIMMGRGLGEVLTETRVAHSIVYGIVKGIGVNSQNKAKLGIMISSLCVVGILGTLAGGTAIIAPIIIPIAAAVGLTPATVGVLFHAVGETALILGPFAPPLVTLMKLTGLSYFEAIVVVSLPFGIVTILVTWFMTKKIQAQTEGIEKYEDADIQETFSPTKESKNATIAFVSLFIIALAYGIIVKAGTNFVVLLMITLAVVTGLVARLKLDEILKLFIKGMAANVSMFLLFLLLDPLLGLISDAGGFDALAQIVRPIANIGGKPAVVLIGGFTGAFGIASAVVAELKTLHEMFLPMLEQHGVSMIAWGAALVAATRVTNFIYPGGNMFGCMGFARSKNVKSMLKNGAIVGAFQIVLLLIYAFFFS